MKKIIIFGLFCVSLMILGCGDSGNSGKTTDNGNDSGREMGSLYGECYSDETCDDGLECDVDKNICLKKSDESGENNDNSNTSAEQTDDNADTNDYGDSIPDDSDSLPDNSDSTPDNDNSPAQTPCNPNPCQNIQNSTGICTEQGTYSYSCGCKTNYTWDSSSKTCKADSKVSYCTGLPEHASWNTASSITQTWNGYSWTPSTTGTYNESASSSECRFRCDTNYNWSVSQCVAATKPATCFGLPENAEWNSVSEITQSWNGTEWSPSAKGTYNETESTEDCIFKCSNGFFYFDGECLNPCDSDPCEDVINSTKVCTALSWQDYSCGCVDGYIWNGFICANPLNIGSICTGQDKCYDNSSLITCPSSSIEEFFGQDSQYAQQAICRSRSFTTNTSNNAESILMDNNSGLEWQQNISDNKYSWVKAQTYCEELTYGGYSDWRLPTPQELLMVENNSSHDSFWSSAYAINDDSLAKYVCYGGYADCVVTTLERNRSLYVRCVRGFPMPKSLFITSKIDSDEIVTDVSSALIWQNHYVENKTWQEALNYCETSTYAGYDDWRLPNMNELISLINYDRYNPASDFPDMQPKTFWSSSTYQYNTSKALIISLKNGYVGSHNKTMSSNTICVRTGNRNTQTTPCTDLPENAYWNSVSTITQVWDGSSWQPASTAGVYNENESRTECRFKCNPRYTWNGTICEADSRIVDCEGLREDAEWNTVSSITQTWDGLDWQPTVTAVYDENESTTECRFKCETGYDWNGWKCVRNLSSLPGVLGRICTGQTLCYNTSSVINQCPINFTYDFSGQDPVYAEQGFCNHKNLTVENISGDNIVIDNNTGLEWQQTVSNTKYCSASYGGYNDWRLPTPQELLTIAVFSYNNHSVANSFINIPDAAELLSSQTVSGTNSVWALSVYTGGIYASGTIENNNNLYALCVRPRTHLSTASFKVSTVEGDEVVIDSTTELMWQKNYVSDINWQSALSYCGHLNYAGHSDWRLPNKNELASLVNYNQKSPASDFPDMPFDQYYSFWSSSTFSYDTESAWTVSFDTGSLGSSGKTSTGYKYVRCVRR